jgi:hypothetical protein
MLARIVALLLAALPAFAATTYDVTKQRGSRTDSLTVVADGERARADLATREEDAILYTSILWHGGPHAIALNASNATWYAMPAEPLALKSRYLNPLPSPRVKNLRWTMSEANGTYTARLTYDVHGSVGGNISMRVRCSADYVVVTTDRHPRVLWLGRIFADTGYPEVDAHLATADASIARFPTRLTLTATRTYDGGPPMQDAVAVEVSNVRETAADPKAFVRPAEYRNQKPVIAAPGR